VALTLTVKPQSVRQSFIQPESQRFPPVVTHPESFPLTTLPSARRTSANSGDKSLASLAVSTRIY
jgi:hypothetical protein